MRRIDDLGDVESGPFDIDLAQESALRAARTDGAPGLAPRPVDRSHMIMLGGAMQPYLWTINGQTGDHTPITAKTGERVHLSFHNMSMMDIDAFARSCVPGGKHQRTRYRRRDPRHGLMCCR